MVKSIKARTIEALRKSRKWTLHTSGRVNNVHGGPYVVGVDWARHRDATVRFNGTMTLDVGYVYAPYIPIGP